VGVGGGQNKPKKVVLKFPGDEKYPLKKIKSTRSHHEAKRRNGEEFMRGEKEDVR